MGIGEDMGFGFLYFVFSELLLAMFIEFKIGLILFIINTILFILYIYVKLKDEITLEKESKENKKQNEEIKNKIDNLNNILLNSNTYMFDLNEYYDNKLNKYNNRYINNSSNSKILKEKEMFIKYNALEVEKALKEFIRKNIENKIYNSLFSVKYIPSNRLAIIEYQYNDISFIPDSRIGLYGLRWAWGNGEREELYENYIYKVALKMVDCILSFEKNYINNVIFNGYLYNLNPATGYNEKVFILSLETSINQFSKINLYKVIPEECLKSLNYRITKNLFNIRSITPFATIDTELIDNSLIDNIDFNINGYEFEEVAKKILIADGFKDVEVTSSSGDFGADVIAFKNDIKYAIQCKKYVKPVGVKAVQEVIGSKSIYNCHVAVVLTNNIFTIQAKKLAEKNNVLLWDREKLKELITNFEAKSSCN